MSSVTADRLTSVTQLFIVSAAVEIGAGVALLVAPAVVIGLVFGSSVDVFPAASLARLTGAALLSLGAACWWARAEGPNAAARALVGALFIYNAAVVLLVMVGTLGALGPLQWAAVVLHTALGIWCARILVPQRV